MSTDKVRDSSGTSDQLLPGKGHTPSYGIHDNSERDINYSVATSTTRTPTSLAIDPKSKERVRVVARCVLIVCLASVVAGMNIGFSSPALPELKNSTLTPYHQLFPNDASLLDSIFGVRIRNCIRCSIRNGLMTPAET